MNQPRLQIPPSIHLLLLSSVALLVWAYGPAWTTLFSTWSSDPDYNHGFLVIPISVWLLWQRREELASLQFEPSWWGAGFLLVAGAIRWLGAEYFISQFEVWSIPLWIAGVVLLFGGWELLRWAAGPIIFLWFMTPLPESVIGFVTMPLQRVSAVLSTWTLHLFAQPAVRQGNLISVGEELLNVERVCSGLRICYGTLAMAVAYAILIRPTWPRIVVLLCSSVPIAVFANSVRVTLTALAYQILEDESARSWAHDYAGLVLLPLAIVLLWLVHHSTNRLVTAFEKSGAAGARLLLKTAIAVAVVGTGLWFWQARQADAAVDALLEIANRYEASAQQSEDDQLIEQAVQEWQQAFISLRRYCVERPDDAAAARRLAAAAERLAFNRRARVVATRFYQQAWKLDSQNVDLGFKAAYLAYGAELHRDAITAAEQLQDLPLTSQQRLDAFRLLIMAMSNNVEGGGPQRTTWAEVLSKLEEGITGGIGDGIQDDLNSVACALQAAVIYRQQNVTGVTPAQGVEKSTRIMRELVERRSEDPLAWFALHRFRSAYPDDTEAVTVDSVVDAPTERDPAAGSPTSPAEQPLPDSDEALDRAVALAQQSNEDGRLVIWLAAGDREVRRKQYEAAEEFYHQARQAAPEHYRSYLQLARLQTGLDGRIVPEQDVTPEQRATAISILTEALKHESLNGNLLLNVELIRQRLRSGDPSETSVANNDLEELRRELQQMPTPVRVPLRMNLALMEADICLAGDQPAKAAAVLKASLPDDDEDAQTVAPEMLSSVWLTLGYSLERQGKEAESQEYFRKAVTNAPTAVPTMLHEAVLAERSSDPESAAKLFLDVAEQVSNRPQVWLAAARAELRRQQRLPESRRDFSQAFSVIHRARQADADVAELALIEADCWSLRGDTQNALAVLQRAAEQQPESAPLWRRLAAVSLSAGRQDDSAAALQRFRDTAATSVEAVLLEAELLARREMWPQAREVMSQALAKASTLDERRRLVDASVLIELRAQDFENAEKILTEFASRNPDDLLVQRRLAGFYWDQRDLENLSRVEEDIRRIEGESGVHWQELRARRLVESAIRSTETDEAATMLAEAKTILTGLPRVNGIDAAALYLQGRIAALEGRFAEASDSLESAWRQSPQSVDAAAELIFALRAQGKQQTARDYLAQMSGLIAASPRLFDLALDLRSPEILDDRSRSETVARDWTQTIGDAASHRRLAQLLLATGAMTSPSRMSEVTTRYRTAIELDPSSLQVWVEYLRFLNNSGNSPAETMQELDRFLDQEDISEIDRVFAAAGLLDSMGFRGQASRFWHRALDLARSQDNTVALNRVLNSATVFFLESDLPLAVDLARQAVALNPGSVNNQRLLLTVLTAVDTPEALTEAVGIADNLSQPDTDEQRRAVARAHFRRAQLPNMTTEQQDTLQLSVQMLQAITRPTEADQVLEAQINGLLGDHQTAVLTLSEIAQRSTANAASIRAFVEYWQDHMSGTETLIDRRDRALTRLEDTDGLEAVALRLRLRGGGTNTDERTAIVRDFLQRVGKRQPTDAQRVGLLRDGLLQLVRDSNHQAALDLCRNELTPFTEEQQFLTLTAVLMFQPGPADFRQTFRDLLMERLETLNSDAVWRAAADYFFLRGEWALSEQLYRTCLTRSPADAGAANNLALVVAASRQDYTEAEDLLQQARSAFAALPSPPAFLQDSQAWLLLQRRQPEAAWEILKPLSESAAADASTFLHLAECAQQLGQPEEARRALRIAQQIGITEESLPPMDRDTYEALASRYPPQSQACLRQPTTPVHVLSATAVNDPMPTAGRRRPRSLDIHTIEHKV